MNKVLKLFVLPAVQNFFLGEGGCHEHTVRR